jgi:hypothetical protein
MPIKTLDEWREKVAQLHLPHTHIVWDILAAWYREQQQKPIKTLDEWREEVTQLHLPTTHLVWSLLDDWSWDQHTRTGAPLKPATPLYTDADGDSAASATLPRGPGRAQHEQGLFLRFALPKGTLLLLTPMEYAQGLYRGKMERRAARLHRDGDRP